MIERERALPSPDKADAELLIAWERGLPATGWPRSCALVQSSGDRTVGQLNADLMALHQRLFGPSLELLSACPSCGEAVVFECQGESLVGASPEISARQVHTLERDGYRVQFSLPAPADLMAATRAGAAAFPLALLERCVVTSTHAGDEVEATKLPEPVLDELSQEMDKLDPNASLRFALECPRCATKWSAPVDPGEVVWQKVQAAAEHLLRTIDTLARAYGWTEGDVLQLSPARRAAYLQMVTT